MLLLLLRDLTPPSHAGSTCNLLHNINDDDNDDDARTENNFHYGLFSVLFCSVLAWVRRCLAAVGRNA